MVWRLLEGVVDWFILRGGSYDPLEVGENPILRSEVLPGLWLDPGALAAGDMGRVLHVVQQGLASPEHRGIVERLSIRLQG